MKSFLMIQMVNRKYLYIFFNFFFKADTKNHMKISSNEISTIAVPNDFEKIVGYRLPNAIYYLIAFRM
jgi:hypothetical protein